MFAILFFSCVLFGPFESPAKTETSLADAIKQFNNQAKNDPVGSSQQPLTKDEVVAAIRFWNEPDAPVSTELLSSFKQIGETGALPDNAAFEMLTGYDRGGEHIFDVWSVRIRLERADKSSYAFILRETIVASRTLQEELDRVKSSFGQFPNGDRIPGWHRIERRIDELEKRIADDKKARQNK